MSLELWHATHSTCSQKVRLCLAGDEYSLADVDMALFVHRIAVLDPAMIGPGGRVGDWYARMQAREASGAAMNWKPMEGAT